MASSAQRDPLPLLVAATAALLIAPFFRVVVWLGDEGILLGAAQRILDGGVPYRDFFEFLPPGGILIVTGWLAVAGRSLAAARSLEALTIAATAALAYLACRRLDVGRALAAALSVTWVAFAPGAALVNHHWLTTLASLAAAVFALRLLDETAPLANAVVAGACAGAAAMIVPTRGAAIGLACLAVAAMAPRRRTAIALLSAGAALAPALCLGYLASRGALAGAADGVLRFSATRYASIQSVPFGYNADRQSWPLLLLYPLAFALVCAVLLLERRRALADRRLAAALAFGLAGFLGCFPRPNIGHIGYGAPLGLLLLAHAASRLGPRFPVAVRGAAALLVCLGVAPALLGAAQSARAALALPSLTLPAGPARLGPETDPLELGPLLTRLAALPPGARIAVYPYDPLLPFLVGQTQAAPLDLLVPGYTTPAQYRAECEAITRQAEWLVIDRRFTDPTVLKASWPALGDASPVEKVAFERAIERGYAVEWAAARFELRRRVRDVSAACAAIDAPRGGER